MTRTSGFVVVVVVAVVVCAAGIGCAPTVVPPVSDEHDAEAATLEDFERSLRPAVRARVLAGERADHGADPVAVAAVDDDVFVLLRGRDRLQLLGGPAAKTVPWPSALVVDGSDVVVGSGVAGGVQRFRRVHAVPLIAGQGEGPPTVQLHALPETSTSFDGVSALAAGAGLIDVGTLDGDVVTLRGSAVLGRCRVGLGLTTLVRLPGHLVALSALEHAVVVFALDDDGVPDCEGAQREDFDGLLFSLVADEREGGVDVVVSGIEDHPLDRSGGSFGHIDSFLFRLRFDDDATSRSASRVWQTNLSEHGVVNGKALLRQGDDVVVWGAGSGRRAVVDVDSGVVVETLPAPFGVTAVLEVGGELVQASALDDVVLRAGVRIELERGGSAEQRLGERLVFTTLLGPQQRSDGPLSRFTCESCHIGGGVDGRVHRTGRSDDEGRAVTATTKPLFGLFQNPPLFTRAMDRSVAVMVHAEVKVANANSPQDPWFRMPAGDDDDDDDDDVSPLEARRALIAFFAAFDPPPNPRAFGRTTLDDDEALGLLHFSRRCLSCHEARVFADDAATAVDDVVTALLRGALVFGRDGHEDSGVRPRVHPAGARPSSLRGIGRKTPLLTNGGARDLPELLARVRIDGARLTHQGEQGTALSLEEQAALLRFLRLL